MLARGDRRDFVAIDPTGGMHSLARRVEGAKAADVRQRFADIDPASVPPVAQARQAARANSAQRGKSKSMEIDDATLDRQPHEQAAKLRSMRAAAERVQGWQKDQQQKAEEAKKQEERRRTEDTERRGREREGQVADAGERYSKALGQHYDIKDPYGSLARAAMAEWSQFRKEQNDLKREAAAERDPAKRRLIEMRREIEACDYMAITSTRLAGMSEAIAGRRDHPSAVQDRERAEYYQQRATELRRQRDAAMQQQTQQQTQQVAGRGAETRAGAGNGNDQSGRAAASQGSARPIITREEAAEAWAKVRSRARGRGPTEQELQTRQVENTKQREGLKPNQAAETAPQGKEARQMANREEAAAAWRAARTASRPSGGERGPSRPTGRSGGRGGGAGR